MKILKDIYAEGAVILDVRTSEEYQEDHLSDAVLFPLDQLVLQSVDLNKELPIITYCAHGVRSQIATQILRQRGYEAYDGGAMPALKKVLFDL